MISEGTLSIQLFHDSITIQLFHDSITIQYLIQVGMYSETPGVKCLNCH